MNGSVRNGAKFIDTWNGFTDKSGRYSPYGPDMTGQVKRLRVDDGVHFTMRGYLKLAHFVEKELRRDLNLAKIERNIPLAGNEEEQAKVMGRDVVPGQSDPALDAATRQGAPASETDATTGTEQAQAEATQPQLQESNVGDVSVVRPAMDQALQAAQSLSPQAPASAMTEAEMVTSELANGLTAVATISAVTDLSLASSRPRRRGRASPSATAARRIKACARPIWKRRSSPSTTTAGTCTRSSQRSRASIRASRRTIDRKKTSSRAHVDCR